MAAGNTDQDLELPGQFTHLPIRALRVTSRRKIAQFLDLDGNVMVCEVQVHYGMEELDIVNNYNGLAELIGFGYLEIQNLMRCKSPTEELLHTWTAAVDGGPTVQATVGNLWKFLFMMERFDVLTDCRRAILNDCRVYDDNQQMQIEAERYRFEKMEQDPTVTNSEMQVDEFKYSCVESVKSGESVHYNAFVSYNYDDQEDLKFVRELIEEMEVKRGLKLFVPGRDDLPGSAYHVITAYLIEKKCDRVALVMSNSFLESEACDFQLKFAHSLAPGARSKKLIPIIRNRSTQIPRILRFLAVCDFSKIDMKDWVLDRLFSAIIAPIGPVTYFNDSDMNEYSTYRKELENSIYPRSTRNPFMASSSSGISSSMDNNSSMPGSSNQDGPSSSTSSSSVSQIYQRVSEPPQPSSSSHTIAYTKDAPRHSKPFSLFSSLKRNKSKKSSTSAKEGKKGEAKASSSRVADKHTESERATHVHRENVQAPPNKAIQMTNMSDVKPEQGITSSSAGDFVKVDFISDPTFTPKGPPSIDSSMEIDSTPSSSTPPKIETKPVLPPKPDMNLLKNRGQIVDSNYNSRQPEPTIHYV